MTKQTFVAAGIGPGLGMGVARKFGKEGFRIAMISRSKEKQRGYIEELNALGIEAHSFIGDMYSDVDIGRAFAEIKSRFGTIDVLNYSPQPPLVKDLHDWMPLTMPREELMRKLQICFLSGVTCIEQVVHDMVARGKGTIITTATTSAIEPIMTLTPLSLGFAALRNYMHSLNQAVQDKGVHAGVMVLGLLVEKGDPYGDPDVLAEKYYEFYLKGSGPEMQVRSPIDPREHHIIDMKRFGVAIPKD
jgi:short-subunit dehydrogenase